MDQTTTHKDDERVQEGGHTGRFILPSDKRFGGATTRSLGARTIREFALRQGAISANERAAYAGHLQDAPQRAMATYEGDGAINRHGKRLVLETMLNLMPGEVSSAPWLVLAQWNVAPSKGVRWRSPPVAIGLRTINGVECLTFDARHLVDTASAENGRGVPAAPPVAIQRRQHQIRMEMVDGRGGDGAFKVTLDGKVVCDYAGPLGYPGYGSPYLGYGIYRAPEAKEPITVRYEAWTESSG